ncbi:uncharacterized protein LOC108915460 [Anoplophora glabripennis]|uniref:uncharacterized protein LOC108915460 n=1 Tax=Anoplophora glabripennis TaxID=217634 RepID=UPI000875121C|nr:uncharacterized protein LOC108915460 [Anoplophora glabripennis]
MKDLLRCLPLLIVSCATSYPISQPVYPNNQYISAQAVPSVTYRQPSAPGYDPRVQSQYARQPVATHPVYETRQREGLQNYASYSSPQQPIQQVLLTTGVDRQVQKAAQIGGPNYLQQVQATQLASQAQEAFAAAQRKASSQTFNNRPIQPAPVAVATQQQPQQYVREQPLRYISRPVTAQYRVQQPQQDAREKENEEDYDPNPSYQFGFDVKDDLYTNYQNRKEQRDGNKITGSYSVVDSDGFIRTVQYTADPKEGFKAEVTRQPTDIVVKIPKPDPQFQNIQRPQQQRYVQDAPRGHQDQRPSNAIYQYQ